jgi:hypothetical protein
MHKALFVTIVAVVSAVALAASALAASPTKSGVYQGTLFETSAVALKKKVRLVVTKSGTGARVIWWCGEGRAPSTLRVQIAADGTFKGTSNVGTLTVWGVKGKFVSATKARMALQLKTICDAKGGTVNLELQS